MATESWRQATRETVISAAVILASDVILQHLDGRLNLATDKVAVKKALEYWAASRPGQVLKSAMKKGGSGTPMGTNQSPTLESDFRSLLKAHGISNVGEVRGYRKGSHTYDMMLGNGQRVTVRMDPPSIYAILIEWCEHGYNLLSQRVLNAGLVEQALMGSVMAVGVVVGGTYLVRAIRSLDPTSNNPKAILPATDDDDHEVKLGADEDEGTQFDDGQDQQNAMGDESGVEKVEEVVVEEEVEQGPDVTELKYMEVLQCLAETSSAFEVLKLEAEQQKELLATNDWKYMEALRCLAETSSALQVLESEDGQQKELLATKADQQRKTIVGLTNRAEERTKAIKHLTTRLADEQSEKSRLKMDLANLRSDNYLQATTIRTLHANQREQEEKVSQLRKKNSALELDANKSVKIVEELETANEELGAELISLIEDNQDLETQLDEDTVAFDNKLNEVDQLTTDAKALRAEIEISQKTIDALRSGNEKLEEHTKALESKNNDLQKTLSEAKDNAKTLQDKNAALKEEVVEGKQECRGLLEKCDEGGAELKSKDDKMQQLKKALRDNGRLSLDKDRRISELKKACKQQQAENDESDAACHGLEEEVGDLTEARDSAQTKLKSTLFELEQANIDLNRVRTDLEESRKENKALKEGKDKVDEGEGHRDEAHEEDKEDGSDEEYEDARDEAHEEDEDEGDKDAHDEHGPDSGGNELGQGEDDNHHGEGHDDGGNDDDEEDNQGGDAPDAGAGKVAQGSDDNQAGEQSATPTTTQKAPDGLSDTIRSPSVSPLQAGPANHGSLEIPPAVADPPYPMIQHPQLPQPGPVQSAPATPQKAPDGLSDTIRSPSVYPLQAGPASDELPGTPPAVPGPMQSTSGAPAIEGRRILPIRRRKNAPGRDGVQKNISPKQEPDVDSSIATSPTQTSSAQDTTQQQPLKSDESIESKRSSPTSLAAEEQSAGAEARQHGDPTDEAIEPKQSSSTYSVPEGQSTGAEDPEHGDPTDESIDPGRSSLLPPMSGGLAAASSSTLPGSLTYVSNEFTQPTPIPTNAEEQPAGTDSKQEGTSTDESINPLQSSLLPSVPGRDAATTESTIQGSPTNGSNEFPQSPPIPSKAEEQPAGTDSKQEGNSTDESIDPVRSSLLPSVPGRDAATTESTSKGSPTNEFNESTQSSPTPSNAQEQAAKVSTYLEKINAWIKNSPKAPEPLIHPPFLDTWLPTPSTSPLSTPTHEAPSNPFDESAPAHSPESTQSRDETDIFNHDAPSPPSFTPWPAALPSFLTSMAKYSTDIFAASVPSDPSSTSSTTITSTTSDQEEEDAVNETQTQTQVKKKHRRRKPRPKASHFETGGGGVAECFCAESGV